MKKFLAILLTLLLVFSLAACKGGSADPATADDSGASTQPDAGGPASAPGNSYAAAYELYYAITTAMNVAFDGVVDPHNAALQVENETYWSDPDYYSGIFLPFLSIDIAYTATFEEDNWAGISASLQQGLSWFDLTDVVVERTAANSYRLAYRGSYTDTETWESTEGVYFESLCQYDPGTGALRFAMYAEPGGVRALQSLIQFVPLGGDRYALISRSERAVVEYKDGVVTAFDYGNGAALNDPDADNIFPAGSGTGAAWVGAQPDIQRRITLQDGTMTIWIAASDSGYQPTAEHTITITP